MTQTSESLREQINSVQDLQSVVKTMKALASVQIRQYERAVESLVDYNRTLEMGLQIVLRQRYFQGHLELPISDQPVTSSHKIGAIMFGSDQGLCGQFNQQIAHYGLSHLDQWQNDPNNRLFIAVGARIVPYIKSEKQSITAQFSLPNSVEGIRVKVQDILLTIEQWRTKESIEQIILFYNQSLSGASYRPTQLQLLPLDADWLRRLQRQSWPSSTLPTFTMDWKPLFSALIRQYLFVSLYRAFAESMASENSSRLFSMQAADKNIEDRLSELNSQYRRQRQSSITAELLDIVSGFEALENA